MPVPDAVALSAIQTEQATSAGRDPQVPPAVPVEIRSRSGPPHGFSGPTNERGESARLVVVAIHTPHISYPDRSVVVLEDCVDGIGREAPGVSGPVQYPDEPSGMRLENTDSAIHSPDPEVAIPSQAQAGDVVGTQ